MLIRIVNEHQREVWESLSIFTEVVVIRMVFVRTVDKYINLKAELEEPGPSCLGDPSRHRRGLHSRALMHYATREVMREVTGGHAYIIGWILKN